MNDLNQSRGILRKGIVVVVFFVGLAFTAVLTLTLTQQTQAGFDCSGNNWSVGNEADLNAAVACYNSQTTSNEYTIIFTQNISLTTSTISINNQLSSINGITLTVDGGGFIIDGQNIVDVRPFHIGLKNRVNIDNITITGGYSRGGGGGIFNGGTLTLNNTRVYSNTASTAGGIDNNGTLTLKNSSVSYNSADTIAGISSGNILNLYFSTRQES